MSWHKVWDVLMAIIAWPQDWAFRNIDRLDKFRRIVFPQFFHLVVVGSLALGAVLIGVDQFWRIFDPESETYYLDVFWRSAMYVGLVLGFCLGLACYVKLIQGFNWITPLSVTDEAIEGRDPEYDFGSPELYLLSRGIFLMIPILLCGLVLICAKLLSNQFSNPVLVYIAAIMSLGLYGFLEAILKNWIKDSLQSFDNEIDRFRFANDQRLSS